LIGWIIELKGHTKTIKGKQSHEKNQNGKASDGCFWSLSVNHLLAYSTEKQKKKKESLVLATVVVCFDPLPPSLSPF
jgi:hypothetical protein